MTTRICFFGPHNLPVLAREYNRHGIGGESVQHTLLAKALTARGYEVSMVGLDFGQQDGATWDGIRSFKTFDVSAGLPVLRFFHPRWTSTWAALRRADADVYYVSCAGLEVGIVAMFAQRNDRKLIFRIASDMDCDPSRLLIDGHYWRDKRFYGYGLRHADAILAQSERQRAAMKRNFGLESTLAPMLVDHPKSILEFEARSFPVLWVSNIRQLKRPDLLLALAVELPEIQMHMIGGPIAGSEDLYEAIRAEAAARPNVAFHGRVAYHDVNDFFAGSRVFVNTSDIEGFPNSYLQAWARGTPVVAYFDPDGLIAREGLGCAAHNPAELRDAVRTLATDPNRWRETSARCRAFMEREYDEDRALAPYLDAIERLTRAKSAA